MKKIAIMFCIISHSCEVFGQLQFVQNFLETTVTNITRVRTPEERDSRWRDFAILDFMGLVQQYDGYTAEEYEVQTEDGYILKLHRISGSPLSPKAYGKPVVFFGHGLFLSSDMQVILGPQHSLSFLLADAGYDVWLGNFRGNSYSSRHIKDSASCSNYDFWNFSMDEMGQIDLPLFIDTVLAKTNQKKLTYIGYSMGSTVSYILLSSKPEYNDKMNLVFNMAPVAIFTRPLSQLLNLFLVIESQIKTIADAQRNYCLLPQSKITHIFGRDVCGSRSGAVVCDMLLKFVGRIDQVNSTAYPAIFAHIPSGTSFKTVDHYAQMMKSGKFRHYDYGAAINKAKYNTISPPEYDLSQITSPQAMFYAVNDIYGNLRNTKTLKSKLPNVVAFERAPKNFNHLDFGMNVNARNVIYYRMLDIIAKYA